MEKGERKDGSIAGMCVGTFVAQDSRVDPPIARYVCVAHARGYHLDEELICIWLAREKVFVFPLVLRVGNYAFAGDGVFGRDIDR
jgi:hypothetical protein